MPDGEDYLLRPILRGVLKYESILDGTVDLLDIAVLNDAIYIEQENQRLYYENERLKSEK